MGYNASPQLQHSRFIFASLWVLWLPINISVVGLATHWLWMFVCVWWHMMDWCPIQDVFLSCSRLWIHHSPNKHKHGYPNINEWRMYLAVRLHSRHMLPLHIHSRKWPVFNMCPTCTRQFLGRLFSPPSSFLVSSQFCANDFSKFEVNHQFPFLPLNIGTTVAVHYCYFSALPTLDAEWQLYVHARCEKATWIQTILIYATWLHIGNISGLTPHLREEWIGSGVRIRQKVVWISNDAKTHSDH